MIFIDPTGLFSLGVFINETGSNLGLWKSHDEVKQEERALANDIYGSSYNNGEDTILNNDEIYQDYLQMEEYWNEIDPAISPSNDEFALMTATTSIMKAPLASLTGGFVSGFMDYVDDGNVTPTSFLNATTVSGFGSSLLPAAKTWKLTSPPVTELFKNVTQTSLIGGSASLLNSGFLAKSGGSDFSSLDAMNSFGLGAATAGTFSFISQLANFVPVPGLSGRASTTLIDPVTQMPFQGKVSTNDIYNGFSFMVGEFGGPTYDMISSMVGVN